MKGFYRLFAEANLAAFADVSPQLSDRRFRLDRIKAQPAFRGRTATDCAPSSEGVAQRSVSLERPESKRRISGDSADEKDWRGQIPARFGRPALPSSRLEAGVTTGRLRSCLRGSGQAECGCGGWLRRSRIRIRRATVR